MARVGLVGLALLVLSSGALAAESVRWRPARPSDAAPRAGMEVDAWELRAVSPDARHGLVLRFEGVGSRTTVWWRHYQRGAGVAAGVAVTGTARWRGQGFTLTSGAASIVKTPIGWAARINGNRVEARFRLRQRRAGPTIGPLISNGKAAWLSVLAVGEADGSFAAPHGDVRKRVVMRGWRAVYLRESLGWATYHVPIYARLDLAVSWRSASQLTLAWGVEPTHNMQRQWNTPDDTVWRGVLVRLGRGGVCAPAVKRTGVIEGTRSLVLPTSTLAASCGRRQIGFQWIRREDLGSDASAHHLRLTGIARSSDGGIGFLEQTVAPG